MNGRSPEDIFNDALELPPEQRRGFVERACGSDTVTRHEVLELLDVAMRHPDLLAQQDGETRAVPAQLGNYRLLDELGHGAMGRVYLAEDVTLDRKVAIKLLPERLATAQGAEWLLREARILAKLTHPRIAVVYAVEFVDGFHFIAMEYVRGQTLAAHLSAGALPVQEAIRICRQVAEGLEAAHEAGIIHRDLKPLNVMLTRAGDAKILDFGIAKVKELPAPAGAAPRAESPLELSEPSEPSEPSQTSSATSFLGTPDYMSPEQMQGRALDPRTDLWCLGCILYECLTGRQAFRREPGEPVAQFLAPDWDRLPAGLSAQLKKLLHACLAVDRDDRPARAADVRDILSREWQAILPAKMGRAHRRRLRAAVLVPILAALGMAGFALRPWEVFDRGRDHPAGSSVTATFSHASWSGSGAELAVTGHSDRGGVLWRIADIGGSPVGRPVWFVERDLAPAVAWPDSGDPIVVVCTRSVVGSDRVHGVNARTGEVLWSRTSQASLPPGIREGTWGAAWQATARGMEDGSDLFLICWCEGVHYPSALEFCRMDGSVVGTYYHPGHIFFWAQVGGTGDDPPTIFLYGFNNPSLTVLEGIPQEVRDRDRVPTVFIAFDHVLNGEAFPGSVWPDIGRAAENRYVIVPAYHPDLPSELEAISCREDLTVMATFRDRRRLYFGPGLVPKRFALARWTEQWLSIRDQAGTFPVYSVVGGEALRLDLAVNADGEGDEGSGRFPLERALDASH